jgi:hypothetical protein
METQTTNPSDHRGELSFKFVKCLGHLRCLNPNFPHLKKTNDYNDLYLEGSIPHVLTPGLNPPSPSKCSVVCRLCKSTPSCLKLCSYKMHYIVSKNPNMTRAAVHLGTHDHPVVDGDCRKAMDLIRD